MDAGARKQTLRMLSNGIYVLTSASGGRYGAATVTWLSQASFKPPLLMAALRPESNVFQCLEKSGVAVVHIVDRAQQDMAQRFFAPTAVQDGTLNGEPFAPGRTQAPVLKNALAYCECVVRQLCPLGDHTVVVMEVVEAACRGKASPLTVEASPWQYGG
jgi:flavin reductase (DIM6/NTAB) family NADH-FMN oxidoreductase RutF